MAELGENAPVYSVRIAPNKELSISQITVMFR